MVEELCRCPEGFGVWHRHVWKPVAIHGAWVMQDDGLIQIQVDWRDAYRALSSDGQTGGDDV